MYGGTIHMESGESAAAYLCPYDRWIERPGSSSLPPEPWSLSTSLQSSSRPRRWCAVPLPPSFFPGRPILRPLEPSDLQQALPYKRQRHGFSYQPPFKPPQRHGERLCKRQPGPGRRHDRIGIGWHTHAGHMPAAMLCHRWTMGRCLRQAVGATDCATTTT